MATFVLVPGGWHGGWAYERIVPGLRARGHEALPVTLTGLGEAGRHPCANLDTHVEDVVALLAARGLEDVTLCGHSYGGMVITGVADRVPERLAGLVYVDAYVPTDGDSCWSLTTEAFRELFVAGAAGDGRSVAPPAGLDPRASAHPLASLLQGLVLTGAHERVARRDFVYLSGWRRTPFASTYERLRHDPRWRVHTLPTGHDAMTEAPDRLVEILHGAAS